MINEGEKPPELDLFMLSEQYGKAHILRLPCRWKSAARNDDIYMRLRVNHLKTSSNDNNRKKVKSVDLTPFLKKKGPFQGLNAWISL